MPSEKKLMNDENQGQPLKTALRKHNLPAIEEIQALDGRSVDSLTAREKAVLDFGVAQGRAFGVAIRIQSDADPEALTEPSSPEHAEELLANANRLIHVTIKL